MGFRVLFFSEEQTDAQTLEDIGMDSETEDELKGLARRIKGWKWTGYNLTLTGVLSTEDSNGVLSTEDSKFTMNWCDIY